MQDIKRYRDFSSYIKNYFGTRVQKVSIDTGFTCPNIDGTKGKGGCTYCNNNTFNPKYCKPIKSITSQIEEGKSFFSKKYKTQKYLAYFQAFTNTYAPFKILKDKYDEALSCQDIVGLVIATRPDCISNEILDYLQLLSSKGIFVKLEFGLESTNDRTLEIINRCQSHSDAIDAFTTAFAANSSAPTASSASFACVTELSANTLAVTFVVAIYYLFIYFLYTKCSCVRITTT